MIITGADVSFRHAAAVTLGPDGPLHVETCTVSRQRKYETWSQHVNRARATHREAMMKIAAAYPCPLVVELFPEKLKRERNRFKDRQAAAGAWWASGWESLGLAAEYVEINEWRFSVWPASLVRAKQGNEDEIKQLAIDTVIEFGWEDQLGLELYSETLRGDVSEAALIAEYMRTNQ